MDSLSNRLGWLSMTHSHMHRSPDPRPYPYVIGMPVNTEDYSYQLSAKCRLAGMLKLISVCENACVSALGPVSVTAALPPLLLGSGNDDAAAVLFGHVCLEGSGYTMADYLTLRTMDESYKLTIT